MKETSFYLPDFEGVSDVDKIADIDALEITLKKAVECKSTIDGMISAIEEQKRLLERVTFTYKIGWVRHQMWGEKERYYYYVSVMKIPSSPGLHPFRVDGTYTDCYSRIDAICRARNLVDDFKEKGIVVEFNEEEIE